MTFIDAAADDDEGLHAGAPAAGSGPAPALSPPAPAAWAVPVLPIEYERAVQPPEARIVWESHPDGETFTDPFSAWRTLSSLGQWAFLLVASVLHFALMHYKVGRGEYVPTFIPVVQCVLTAWVVFRMAGEIRAWGKPVVVSVRSGILTLTRPTLGGVRHWQWPVGQVKRIDVAVGSSTQHALQSLRVRFHGGKRISFFRCKSLHEGVWIAHKLAAAMDLPESAVH